MDLQQSQRERMNSVLKIDENRGNIGTLSATEE